MPKDEFIAIALIFALFGALCSGIFIVGRKYEQRVDRKYWESVIGEQCEDCEKIGYKEGWKRGYQQGITNTLAEEDENRY